MIDFSKPVQTKDGRSVRILATNADGLSPIVGQMSPRNGRGPGIVRQWTQDGIYGFDRHEWNLENVQEEAVTYSYFGQDTATGIRCYGGEYPSMPIPPSPHKTWKGVLRITRKGDRVVKLEVMS